MLNDCLMSIDGTDFGILQKGLAKKAIHFAHINMLGSQH
jgi:hypothetical protein